MYVPEKLRRKLERRIRHADCEYCPLGWEDRGPEDCDAGCRLYGDLEEGGRPGCFWPLWLKRFVNDRIVARNGRIEARSYEDIVERHEREDRKDGAMAGALGQIFPDLGIEPHDDRIYRLRTAYENRLAQIEPDELGKGAPEKKSWIRRLFRHGKE